MRQFRFGRSLTLEAPGGSLVLWVAESFRQRLVGLAGLAALPTGRGLLIPHCGAVHTWGMRFAIDVAFVEWPPAAGSPVLHVFEGVAPMRCVRLPGRRGRHAAAVEAPAGTVSALGMDAADAAVNFKRCPRAM